MPLSLMHFQAEAAKLRQFEADDLAAKRPAEPQPASAPQMKRARVDAEMMASAPGSKDASESVRLENKCGQPTKYSTPCLFSKQCANCGACFRHCPCKSGQEKKCGYQLKTGTGCSRIGNCPACSYCRQSHCTCDPKDVMPLPRGSAGSSKHAKCLHQVKDGTQCNRSGNCPTCKRCLQFHCLCASTAEAEDAVTATSGQINQAHKVLPRCARDLKGGKKCNRRYASRQQTGPFLGGTEHCGSSCVPQGELSQVPSVPASSLHVPGPGRPAGAEHRAGGGPGPKAGPSARVREEEPPMCARPQQWGAVQSQWQLSALQEVQAVPLHLLWRGGLDRHDDSASQCSGCLRTCIRRARSPSTARRMP